MTNDDAWISGAVDLDGQPLPDPKTVSANQLGKVLIDLSTVGRELAADLVTEELRLAQYRRVAELGEWLTKAADSLHLALDTHLNPDDYPED
ncbi:hypothetical protein GCM10010260_84310 [Streptomyces filipinensis]|uniref:Uncharacterized protein n=1 Tax=Streptomyces filipinensis TaxID=66887 RepID=A0A918IKK8_9ACTN|nr:hypothetical protein [Streptomyces filipinensis]GGV31332.1 hypothetical protein GCM10010260_84310 [Streptomyces filipinensis]